MAKVEAAAAATADPFLPQQQQYFYGVPVEDQQPYILLPLYPGNRVRRRRRRGCGIVPSCCACFDSVLSTVSILAFLAPLVLIGAVAFFFWPSNPELRVSRFRLDSFHVSIGHQGSPISLDIAMALQLGVRNPNFLALDYHLVRVAIGYRGRRLGSVTAIGGHVGARGVSYVDAELRLDGIRVIEDALYLIEDIATGSIPLDTLTAVEGGVLHFFSFDIPIEGRVACEIRVNPENQTIIHDDCCPE